LKVSKKVSKLVGQGAIPVVPLLPHSHNVISQYHAPTQSARPNLIHSPTVRHR